MAKKGTGLMIVWADIPAEMEDDFNRWYNEEHLAELLSVPGVLSAARYEATSSGPKHMAVYELESPAVVETEAFTSRPRTEWGSRVSPSIIGTNFINNVYEMIHPTGLNDDIANSDMAPGSANRTDGRSRRTGSRAGTNGTPAFMFPTTRRFPAASGAVAGRLSGARPPMPSCTSLRTKTSRRPPSGWNSATSTPTTSG